MIMNVIVKERTHTMSNHGGPRKGAGRPKGEPRVKVSLTLKPETVALIMALAEDMGIGKGAVIDLAVGEMKK